MKQYVLNIGLNVGNIEPKGQKNLTLEVVKPIYYRIDKSQYNGQSERTMVAVINAYDKSMLVCMLKTYCVLLSQNCISFKSSDNSETGLIYPLNFVGEQMQFNEQHFINLTQTGKIPD